MKKTFKMLLVMGFMAIIMPQISNAATHTYTIPDGAVGISETTYQQLKNAEYTDIENYDQILYQYQNKIVFRADHFGEMYRVPFVGEKPYNPTRYLPDGFYKAGNNYYWLSNGQKMRLPKNAEYSTIYNAITSETMDYVGITENDFSAMSQTCEYYGVGDANTDPTYLACLVEYNQGNELRETLQGKIIIRSGYDGSIFFVENGANHDLQALFGIEKYSTFRKEILKNYSFTVKKSLMKQIPKSGQY